MNVEIEFLEWVNPRAGVTKVEVEGGKPLILKAKINMPEEKPKRWNTWYDLTDEEINDIPFISVTLAQYARLVERKLKEKNGE